MDPESTLADLEQRLARAWLEGDRAFIEGLLGDDWIVIDPSARLLTKREVIEETFASDARRIDSMVVDEVNVRCFGTWAVVTGRTRASGAYRGEPMSVVLRFTDVFAVREGRWQAIASHATLAP
jgi:hypothetical protein